jgi:hypothetical protein
VVEKEINSNYAGKGRMMQFNKPKKIAFIRPYSQWQSGFASCTSSLLENIYAAIVSLEPVVIAIQSNEQINNLSSAQFVIHRDIRSDSIVGILSVSDFACRSQDEHLAYEIFERICEPVPASL